MSTKTLNFSQMSDEEVKGALKEYKIGLTVDEARQIEDMLGRAPSVTEAIIWGIQGSEHCSYKSSRRHLSTLPTKGPNVILGPSEDAGIVEIQRVGEERYGIVLAHESHNHPSQLVPYEGAATGVGGIVRDVTCMGARVIGTLDPLRFGDIKLNEARRIANGVVSGISGYGNPIGVPNLGGDVYFDEAYNDNCLVNVVALGLVKESEIIHSYVQKEAAEKGYDIIILGKPTDFSGMGGASFASLSLDEQDKEANKGAVQEPNPFLKRHLLASTYDLFDKLKKMKALDKVSFKDMGAGGNVCSTVEQVEKWGYGAEVDLAKIHTALDDLDPSVIACAETQERFAWICHPDLTQMILDHYNKTWALGEIAERAAASHVGKVKEGNYVLKFGNEILCDATAASMTQGLQYDRPYKAPQREFSEPILSEHDLLETLKQLLSSENIASRRPIFRKYDKQVQGFTIIESGEADAGVIAPLMDEDIPEEKKLVGVAISADGNPLYGKISPYWQGANAVIESMRNVAAVGADPQALTDCLNYGNPEKEEQMWELVEGIRGIADAAKGVPLKAHKENPTPIISGNVSLYNEGKSGAIPPTAIVACLGRMDDYRKAITMQFKAAGNKLFLIGNRKDECGGSEYYKLFNELGANVPKPDFDEVARQIYAVTDAVSNEAIVSAHDISEGGLAVALCEMSFGGRAEGELGFEVDLSGVGEGLDTGKKLFSETGGFIVEVEASKESEFKEICNERGVELFAIGEVSEDFKLRFNDRENQVQIGLQEARTLWEEGLLLKL